MGGGDSAATAGSAVKCGDSQAVDVAAAGVAVGGELGFGAVDGAVSGALLWTLDFGLDGVVADGVPSAFLVARVWLC